LSGNSFPFSRISFAYVNAGFGGFAQVWGLDRFLRYARNVEIQEQVALAGYTTFGVGGAARYFVEARSKDDVVRAVGWAEERGLPLFVLGGGSNLLVPDEGYTGLVLQIGILGVLQDKSWSPHFFVGAGVSWDSFVDEAIGANCAGIECLAGIPGSVGGTPVQNVGAYGQEVSETIGAVEVFDRKLSAFRWMENSECQFRYRESVFNTTERGRYIVTGVTFDLHYGKPTLRYTELAERFRWKRASLKKVASAVREIRRGKGMVIDPSDSDSRSAGSFFKNPILLETMISGIAEVAGVKESAVPQWAIGPGKVKLPAAWLLEKAGFVKGYGSGPVRISSKHTLALTNRGGATFADVMEMQDEIVAGVKAKFGVRLEREPVVLG
jgi:UDP-N-acetylmuramate dehydrogenase